MSYREASSIAGTADPHPYRILLPGGWIDQPFVNELNPEPPGSVVVVNVHPDREYMERSGIATSTRRVAEGLWPDGYPADRAHEEIVRELYEAENDGKDQKSGSQDMYGLVVPGITRLDYDQAHEGGVFPVHVETTTDREIADWLESVLHVVPVAPRPPGYDPLVAVNLQPEWIRQLGRTGADAFDAILARDVAALGEAMNACMRCWEVIVPASFRDPVLEADWPSIISDAQRKHPGAGLSAAGGGYLYVISEEPVAGAFHPRIRTEA